MRLETTGNGVARFNPNLYADGKVIHSSMVARCYLLPPFIVTNGVTVARLGVMPSARGVHESIVDTLSVSFLIPLPGIGIAATSCHRHDA